jgi:hypothetical protein
MNRLIISIFFLLIASNISGQFRSAGLIAGGGVTVVDVEKVVDPYELSDWNTYSFFIKGSAEIHAGSSGSLGIEAGTNRLYYWEYPAPGFSWFNWRTEWTTNAVIYYVRNIGSRFFLQSGVGVHIFHNGTVPGLLAAAGTSFSVGEKLSIPLSLRIEPIFGTATPIAVNIGTGLKFNNPAK